MKSEWGKGENEVGLRPVGAIEACAPEGMRKWELNELAIEKDSKEYRLSSMEQG